jgi:hypothetical protein
MTSRRDNFVDNYRYPARYVGPYFVRPTGQAFRRPRLVFSMSHRHVCLVGCHASPECSRVLRCLMLFEVRYHQAITHVQLNPLSHILMRHRVEVVAVLHVVVDIDFDVLDINILIRMKR